MRKTSIVTAACLILAASVGGCITSTTHARVTTPAADPLDPSQMMTSAKNLPSAELVDYTFVFE
jgi:hypothetical protein